MPRFIRRFYPERVWAFSNVEKEIFLTFDDGPNNKVTPWVLDQLKQYGAKATFFCVGENITKYPDVFKQTIADGHSIGNHTFNHLNGFRTTKATYIDNIDKAEATIREIDTSCLTNNRYSQMLFRPPYGKVFSHQARPIVEKGYKIVMWDIISYDYDVAIPGETCVKNVLSHVESGSIIVLHDSLKAEKNLRVVLPELLEKLSAKGYSFSRI